MTALAAGPVTGDDARMMASASLHRTGGWSTSLGSLASLAGTPKSLGLTGREHGRRTGSLSLGTEAGTSLVIRTGSAEWLDELIAAAQQLRDELAYGTARVTPDRTGGGQ